MTNGPVTYGTRLRRARLERGLTQEQLANELGTSRFRVIAWESDKEEPWMYDDAIADYFSDASFVLVRDGKSELAAVKQQVMTLIETQDAVLERLTALESRLPE